MIGKTMRKKAALFTTAAAVLLLLTGCSFFLPGAVGPGTSTDSDPVTPDPEYTACLIANGFPEDYAEKLSVLHVLHPSWTFEPLDVTGLSEGRYTWDYVVGEEYSDHRRNLVPPAERYTHMRDPSDLSLYDTGWYAASRPAIEYMMDPRNFLDEVQIFQFCSLAFSGSETPGSVESVLEGTFMEGAFLDGEYSGTTYAEFIFDTGRELGASPVYLAARIRNEQGVRGDGPTVSGSPSARRGRKERERRPDPRGGIPDSRGACRVQRTLQLFQHRCFGRRPFRRMPGGDEASRDRISVDGGRLGFSVMEHEMEVDPGRREDRRRELYPRPPGHLIPAEIQCRSGIIRQFLGAVHAERLRSLLPGGQHLFRLFRRGPDRYPLAFFDPRLLGNARKLSGTGAV